MAVVQKSDTTMEAFIVKLDVKEKADATTFRVTSIKDSEGRKILEVEWTYELGTRRLSNDNLYKLMLLMDYLKGEEYHLRLANP